MLEQHYVYLYRAALQYNYIFSNLLVLVCIHVHYGNCFLVGSKTTCKKHTAKFAVYPLRALMSHMSESEKKKRRLV